MKAYLRRLLPLCLILAAIAAALPIGARATTIIPPTFDELVTRADTVFTGDVLGVRSEYAGEGPTRRIVSQVTFNVLRVMKGQATTPFALQMLGGTVGTRSLVVDGMPHFVTGDRVVVFVKDNGKQFFPAVGAMNGVYRLERNTAAPDSAELVYDHTRRTVESVADIGQDAMALKTRRLAVRNDASPSGGPLTREQFEAAIVGRLGALGLK